MLRKYDFEDLYDSREGENVLREINQGKLVEPFQIAFNDILSSLLEEGDVEGDKKRLPISIEEAWDACACTIETPKLNVHIIKRGMRIPLHGWGDIAILENRKTKAFILLYGESGKNFLDRGVCGGLLPKKAVKAVKKIVASWGTYFVDVHANHLNKDCAYYRRVREAIAKDMKPVGDDLARIVETYIDPVFGKGLVVPLSPEAGCARPEGSNIETALPNPRLGS